MARGPHKGTDLYYQALGSYRRLHPEKSYKESRANKQFQRDYHTFKQFSKGTLYKDQKHRNFGKGTRIVKVAERLGLRPKEADWNFGDTP